MKGIINKGIQEMVEAQFGAEAWERIKVLAGCEEPFFATSQDYPDEMTLSLVQAASEVSGLSAESVMVEYGRFLIPNTMKENYGTYFAMAGSCPREVLLNLNKVHEHVTRSIPNAVPPTFRYEEMADGRLRMHYSSKRGLCAVLNGLIQGVGVLFGQDLQVEEVACTKHGDPECTMEVTFP